jgi:hypothetical protein
MAVFVWVTIGRLVRESARGRHVCGAATVFCPINVVAPGACEQAYFGGAGASLSVTVSGRPDALFGDAVAPLRRRGRVFRTCSSAMNRCMSVARQRIRLVVSSRGAGRRPAARIRKTVLLLTLKRSATSSGVSNSLDTGDALSESVAKSLCRVTASTPCQGGQRDCPPLSV